VSHDNARNGQITIAPGDGASHTATVVGPLHGLGDTNMGWTDVANHLHMRMPHIKFILPNAPTSPVTLNGGMKMPSWYDIVSLDANRADQECDGIEASRKEITSLIYEEVEAGVPLDRIAVAGFSQGGALALYAGLQLPKPLAGVVVMSGYLANANAFKLSPAAAATPVAHFHGAIDPTVRVHWARESAEKLRALGLREYDLKEYPDLGHSANLEEVNDVEAWLRRTLPEPPAAAA
jgi:predicted esterase